MNVGKPMSKTFVLGAGFSKAISTEMPVMDELSGHVRSDLDAKGERPIPGVDTPLAKNFEQWLSYLVEAPPWLTEAERALNRWGFITLTDTVYDVLWTLQLGALGTPCPDWLHALVRYWQANSCTVITFNYDLLVEIAHAVYTNHALASMYSVPITFMDARDSMVFGRENTDEGLRLLKMHGSLNWRYSGPGSPPGDISQCGNSDRARHHRGWPTRSLLSTQPCRRVRHPSRTAQCAPEGLGERANPAAGRCTPMTGVGRFR
jgi:hypothetical protein